MFKPRFLALVASLLLLSCAVSAQKILERPFEKWSKDESLELLNNSPWAQTYQSVSGAAAAAANDALRAQSDNRLVGAERGRSERSGGPPPVIVRLHSSLAIRAALTRLNQIGANYDKLDDKGKAKFNESARGMLECSQCKNYYVVTLTQATNATGQGVEEAIFQGLTNEQMKGNVTLKNEKGETRELAHFLPPQKRGDSAVFFFARNDADGKTLIDKSNSEVIIAFDNAFFSQGNRYSHLIPRSFTFKVSKMIFADQVVF